MQMRRKIIAYRRQFRVPLHVNREPENEIMGGWGVAKVRMQDYPPLLELEVNGTIFQFDDYAIGKIAEALSSVFDYT